MITLTFPDYESDTKLALRRQTRSKDGTNKIKELATIDLSASAIPEHLRHDFVDALSKAAAAFVTEHCKEQ